MNDILELSAQLGKQIAADPRGIRMKTSREALEKSLPDRQLLSDYEQQQRKLMELEGAGKPIEPDDLRRAVSRIRPGRKNASTKQRVELLQQNYSPNMPNAFEKIGISGLDGVHFVRLRDIVRLEAEDNYTHFVLKTGNKITASKTIKAYEDTLIRLNFVRVHKKHIVNMNYMKTYIKGEGGYLVLENGETIEVSRRKKASLMDSVRRLYGEI